MHLHAVQVQGLHHRRLRQLVVAHKHIARTAVVQRAVLFEFACRAGLIFLTVHGGVEAVRIHFDVALAAHVVGQVQRKTKGIVQLESHVARQHLHATGQGGVQNFHAGGQRLKEALFFDPQHFGNALLFGLDFWIGVAHQAHHVGDQLVEERRFLAQLVAMTNSAAHDAALHIAAAFVARHHAIAHQKRGRADVIGNHAQ